MFIKAIISKKTSESVCYGKIKKSDKYQLISKKVYTILQKAILDQPPATREVSMSDNDSFYYQEFYFKNKYFY